MKKITIDDLAIMIQKGFNEVYRRTDDRFSEAYERLVTKKDLEKILKESFSAFRIDFRAEINEDLSDMEERLGNRWGNRIERLEDDMRVVKTKLKLR